MIASALLIVIAVSAALVAVHLVRASAPGLHVPLVALVGALSMVLIVGALIVAADSGGAFGKIAGLLAVVLAGIGLVGSFGIVERLLAGSQDDSA